MVVSVAILRLTSAVRSPESLKASETETFFFRRSWRGWGGDWGGGTCARGDRGRQVTHLAPPPLPAIPPPPPPATGRRGLVGFGFSLWGFVFLVGCADSASGA